MYLTGGNDYLHETMQTFLNDIIWLEFENLIKVTMTQNQNLQPSTLCYFVHVCRNVHLTESRLSNDIYSIVINQSRSGMGLCGMSDS